MSFFRPVTGFQISQYWGKGAWGALGQGGHPGTDYACPAGTPVHACADYEVLYAGFARGFGNHAICLWFPGLKTACTIGHCSANFVSTGDRGKAGDVVGVSGYEGTVIPAGPAGAHLHFETRYTYEAFGGNPPNVDSEQWLKFFEALDRQPPQPPYVLTAADREKIKQIQKAVGVSITGRWDKNTDNRLQVLMWNNLTPPRPLNRNVVVAAFQRAMGLPIKSQDGIFGPGTKASYELCRFIYLGK